MTSSQAAAVELFSTSILSNHKVRSRHERYISILSVKKIPYIYHDLAGDEEAKSRWRRKARDPQIPGLLVHNEWRGTFEEFEESVEFGELDLFLKIDDSRTQKEAEAGLAPALPDLTASTSSQSDISSAVTEAVTPKATLRAPSHTVAPLPRLAQPRAPSQTTLAPALPFAPTGSGGRKEHSAESFLTSLGISDLNLTEEELSEILEGGKSSGERERAPAKVAEAEKEVAGSNGEKWQGKYPNTLGIGTSKPAVARTYVPSAEAGLKPLRLARMGDDSSRSVSSISPLRLSPSARYNSSQISSKALAAEAQASISSRSFSSLRLREAVSKGDKLEDAFQTTRATSNTDEAENVVGREDLDDLMSSLGLGDVKMTEEEADAFLLDGTIPTGLDSHGSRLGRAGSTADKARNEAAARDVAQRAKEKGYGSGSSRPSSVASSVEAPGSPEFLKSSKETPLEEKRSSKEATEGVSSAVNNGEAVKSDIEEDKKEPERETAATDPTKEEEKDEEGQKPVGVVEETNVESTPKQKKISLPPLPLSHDSVLGKSSSTTEAFLTADEMEDGEKTPEGRLKDPIGEVVVDDVEKVPSISVVAKIDEAEKEAEAKEEVPSSLLRSSEIKTEQEEAAPQALAATHSSTSDIEEKEPGLAEESAPLSPAKPALDVEKLATPSQTSEETAVTCSPGKESPSDKQQQQQSLTDHTNSKPAALKLDDSISSFVGVVNFEEVAPLNDVLPPPTPIKENKSPQLNQKVKSPRSASNSPTIPRRQLRSPSLTPSRKGMDVPRPMPSNTSLSELSTSPTATRTNRGGLNSPLSPGVTSPNGSEGVKSPKSGTKKFFSIGRRKGGRSSSSKKSGDNSDSEEEVTTITSPTMSNSSSGGGNGRAQKTLSMILKEADEAMQEMEGDGDEDDEGGSARGSQRDNRLGDSFNFDLDDLDEDDGIEVAGR